MTAFPEYDQLDGLGLAELIRSRQLSAAEVCEAAVARIERVNPKIHAVVTPLFESARRWAAQGPPAGMFPGVPFLLKDLLSVKLQIAAGDVVECHVPPYEPEFAVELLRPQR